MLKIIIVGQKSSQLLVAAHLTWIILIQWTFFFALFFCRMRFIIQCTLDTQKVDGPPYNLLSPVVPTIRHWQVWSHRRFRTFLLLSVGRERAAASSPVHLAKHLTSRLQVVFSEVTETKTRWDRFPITQSGCWQAHRAQPRLFCLSGCEFYLTQSLQMKKKKRLSMCFWSRLQHSAHSHIFSKQCSTTCRIHFSGNLNIIAFEN